MLYKINIEENENNIKPMPFTDFSELEMLEEDLEELLANNLLDLLYEEAPLMPIFRQRSFRKEADLYALNENGDLVLFELKLGEAGAGAVSQILRYSQDAGQWTYNELSKKYKKYAKDTGDTYIDLIKGHQEAFELKEEKVLKPEDFNNKQHLRIIGRAANKELVDTVDYWKDNILIDFIPYRVYEINESYYFEFYTPPYDKHYNPAETKGVFFDTNKKYNKDDVWYMLKNNRVSAFGGAKNEVERLNKKDCVFYKHKGKGIIAAAEVISSVKEDKKNDEKYCEVKFLTSKPSKGTGINNYLSFKEVQEILNKNIVWRGTVLNYYIKTKEEIEALIEELNKKLLYK